MDKLFHRWRAGLRVKDKPDEFEAKDLIAWAGIPVPPQRLWSGKEPIDRADLVEGLEPPFVVKLCSSQVLHKTDVGGVRLGVGAEELPRVLEEMSRRFPGENMLIYHMEKIRGPELILGALKDPTFGAAVMAGAGGILTELYRDVSFRLAPCRPSDVEGMLSELALAPVFEGFRGSSMDKGALVDLIVLFSRLASAAAREGAQLDINPLVWTGSGWTVLDGKCVFL